ncbi:MAG: hypothetical protein HQM12_21335 [SAR324 cluster bacterium]|nr:hypothetical protein [SAR324 cluster bacterium]
MSFNPFMSPLAELYLFMNGSRHLYRQVPPFPRSLLLRPTQLPLGETIPRIEVESSQRHIQQKQLRAFEKVCGYPFQNKEGLPVSFIQILAGNLFPDIFHHESFPLRPTGLIHIKQTIRMLRTISRWETLKIVCTTEGHRNVRKGVEFDIHATIFCGSEQVWSSTTTFLSRSDYQTNPLRVVNPVIQGVLKQRTWDVPENSGRRFAALSGDFNLIHLHSRVSRFFGFENPIAHGVWSISRCLGDSLELLPEPPLQLDIRFKKPLFLPGKATLFVSGNIQNLNYEVRSPDGKTTFLTAQLKALTAR